MPDEDVIKIAERRQGEPYDRLSQAQHQLGTELGVIFACCYKLGQSTERPLPPDAAALLRKVQRSAEKIRDLRVQLIAAVDD